MIKQLEQLTEEMTSGEHSDEVKLLYAPDRNIKQKLLFANKAEAVIGLFYTITNFHKE